MRDDRDIVDHLDQNCYVSGRLQYLIIVVAAVGSGNFARAAVSCCPLRRQRRNLSVGRVHH